MSEQNPPRPEDPQGTSRAADTPDPPGSDGSASGTARSGPTRPGAAERPTWTKRRRDKIANEIGRNRRGEYRVPTWVLTTLLVVIVGTWLAVILLA